MSEFKAHGSYTISNCIGYLIELNNAGDAARLSCNGEITDWFEIEYVDDEDEPDEMKPVIDPDGYNVPLNLVMKL